MEKDLYWPLQENSIRKKEINALLDFLKSSDRFTQGSKVKEFEEKWSEWQGCKYSVFVNSGSSANLLLIDSLKELYNWRKGTKIIVPAITWSTNISPIMQNGLEPVFVDVGTDSLSFDINSLKEELNKHDNIAGIFITHLLGIPADIEEIKELCEKKDIKIFEDCCESHGAKINGEKVGNFGEGSTFSFFFGHHITSIEGGAICTNNKELYRLLLLKRSHGLARELPKEDFEKARKDYPGINPSFLFLTTGYNVRNHEMCAVIALEQLKGIDDIIIKRNNNFKRYHKLCEENSDILYLTKKEGVSSFSLPFIFKEKKDLEKFKELLKKERIESRPIISGNLLKQPFLKKYSKEESWFPTADMINDNGVYIGNNQFIGEEQLEKLKEIFKELR